MNSVNGGPGETCREKLPSGCLQSFTIIYLFIYFYLCEGSRVSVGVGLFVA